MNSVIRSTTLAGNQDRETPIELAAQIDGAQKVSIPSLDKRTDAVNASRELIWVEFLPLLITTGLYTAGDSIGGLMTLPNVLSFTGETARLQQITIVDLDNERAVLDLIIWDRNPVTLDGATVTNDSPLALGTSATHILARVPILAADYGTTLTDAFATLRNLNVELTSQFDNHLYAALIAVGGPTYTAGTDLSVRLAFQRD